MSVKKKSNIDDNSEKYVIADNDSVRSSDNDSDGSDIVFPIMFHYFEKCHTVDDYQFSTSFLKTFAERKNRRDNGTLGMSTLCFEDIALCVAKPLESSVLECRRTLLT